MKSKIVTRKGDQGETQLLRGGRVFKTDPRIEAYGSIDELNAVLGIMHAVNAEKPSFAKQSELEIILGNIQQTLFVLGTELATEWGGEKKGLFRIQAEDTEQLEQWIDSMDEFLPPLNAFILPGSSVLSAHCHHARTVCRRAERNVWALVHDYSLPIQIPVYLNRLSDALFVMGRWVCHLQEKKERVWKTETQSS